MTHLEFNAVAILGTAGNPSAKALELYLREKGILMMTRLGTGHKILSLVCQSDDASLELPPPPGLEDLHRILDLCGCKPSWVSPRAVSLWVHRVSGERLRPELAAWIRHRVPLALHRVQGMPAQPEPGTSGSPGAGRPSAPSSAADRTAAQAPDASPRAPAPLRKASSAT